MKIRFGSGSAPEGDARIRLLAVIALGGVPGGFMGALVGVRLAAGTPYLLLALLAGALVGGGLVIFMAHRFSEGAGSAAGSLFFPGRGRSARPGYSAIEALLAQEKYREALALLEAAALERKRDPTPLTKGARVLRDELHRHGEAALWLTRARARVAPGSREAAYIDRELEETRLRMRPLSGDAEAAD